MNVDQLIPNRKNYHMYLFGLILIAGFIFRFYNFPNRFGFDFDASRDGLTASLMAKNFEIPLLGSISSATSLNSGPWYYYFLAPFEVIFPVYGSWIMIGLSNLIFILIIYKIGEVLENKKFGLVLAAMVALAPSQVILSSTLSNPSPVPVFASLAILFFIIALKKKSLFPVFLVGFLVGLGINIHYEMIGFLIIPILLFIFLGNRIKSFVLLLAGFFLPFMPLIIYDLKNDWINFKGALVFLTTSNNTYYVPNRWLFYVRDFWPDFWSYTLGIPLILTIPLVTVFAFLVFLLIYKRSIKKEYLLIFIVFIVDFIQLRYFPQEKRIYYLYYLYPFIFMFSGYVLFRLSQYRKSLPLALVTAILIFSFMIKKDLNILNPNEYHVQLISQKHTLLEKYPNDEFNIYSCSENMDRGMGLTYLLQRDGKSSAVGKKIGLADKTCGIREGFMKIDNTTLFELEGTDDELAGKNWHSISSKSMEQIKSMQLYRSY